MAELLVRVIDKINADETLNLQCLKRGDVVSICEDGHTWGTVELANPDWRIVTIPGVAVEDLEGLLMPEIDVDSKAPTPKRRRMFNLNLDAPEIGKSGLREFFDNHVAVAVDAKEGFRKDDVKIVTVVESKLETVIPDAQSPKGYRTEIKTLVTEDVSYPLDKLDAVTVEAVAALAGVEIVGPSVRQQCAAEMSLDTLTAITAMKPVVKDETVLGDSVAVIG